jgi:hypothetical protein
MDWAFVQSFIEEEEGLVIRNHCDGNNRKKKEAAQCVQFFQWVLNGIAAIWGKHAKSWSEFSEFEGSS